MERHPPNAQAGMANPVDRSGCVHADDDREVDPPDEQLPLDFAVRQPWGTPCELASRASLYTDDRLIRSTRAASAMVSVRELAQLDGYRRTAASKVHHVRQVCHSDPPSICSLHGVGAFRPRRSGRGCSGRDGSLPSRGSAR